VLKVNYSDRLIIAIALCLSEAIAEFEHYAEILRQSKFGNASPLFGFEAENNLLFWNADYYEFAGDAVFCSVLLNSFHNDFLNGIEQGLKFASKSSLEKGVEKVVRCFS